MTEEEKKAKVKQEEEVPKGFIEAVNEFYDSSDIIFKCFDEIYRDYLHGKDIIEDLKEFRNKKARIFDLINDVFLREERVKKWLDNANIEDEKKDKIFEFAQRYSDLEDDILVAYFEISSGFINPLTSSEALHSFDSKINVPLIDLKLHSGSNIFHTKTPANITYLSANTIQSAVLKCIEEIKDKNIAVSSSNIKETANDIKKDAEKILDMIKEIERKGKKK